MMTGYLDSPQMVSQYLLIHSKALKARIKEIYLFIYLFGVLRRIEHCTGHITTGSWKGRGNQYT